MDAWFHSENPYPFVPDDVLSTRMRCRPAYQPVLRSQGGGAAVRGNADEYLLCDELGLNITSSEHHAGINCIYGASPVILGIVARQTRNIRLLSMGTLVTVRQDPVRVAEDARPPM